MAFQHKDIQIFSVNINKAFSWRDRGFTYWIVISIKHKIKKSRFKKAAFFIFKESSMWSVTNSNLEHLRIVTPISKALNLSVYLLKPYS